MEILFVVERGTVTGMELTNPDQEPEYERAVLRYLLARECENPPFRLDLLSGVDPEGSR